MISVEFSSGNKLILLKWKFVHNVKTWTLWVVWVNLKYQASVQPVYLLLIITMYFDKWFCEQASLIFFSL